jgi:SAM-dependent methyltransferase
VIAQMGERDAQAYYATGRQDLIEVVLEALRAAGRPTEPLDPDDLAALDEFHGLGRAATLTLAVRAGLSPGDRVLDVGAGIGGPARVLARHFGARVTALDPTERFRVLGEELTWRAGLADRVTFVQADARTMPFGAGAFDLVLTQAVWSSVEDKAAMLAEIHRVLVPDGKLVIFEAVKGPGEGDLSYPLPWADGLAESFVVSAEDVGALVAEAGFAVAEWLGGVDLVTRIGEVAGSGAEAMSTGADGVDLSLLMPDFEARMAGLGANIAAERIELALGVLVRV